MAKANSTNGSTEGVPHNGSLLGFVGGTAGAIWRRQRRARGGGAMNNTIAESNRPTLLVPGFVRGLNATAEAAGFSVDISVRQFRADDSFQSIVSTWHGPLATFEHLTFLPESIRMRRPAGAQRATSRLTISWPGHRESHPILHARLQFPGNSSVLELDGGPLPKAIRLQGAVEITEYDDEMAYHGSRKALIAEGVCTANQFPVRRWQMTNYRWMEHKGSPKWKTTRLPDGNYVHWRETEEAYGRRRSEESGASTPSQTTRSDGYAGFCSINEFRPIFTLALGMHSKQVADVLPKLRAIKSRDGYIYGVSGESEKRIQGALEDLEIEIRDAQLYRQKYDARSDEEKDAARQAVAHAERDGAFRSFLQGLNLK